MQHMDFDGLIEKAERCDISEFKEILSVDGLTEVMKARLEKRRRSFETDDLKKIIHESYYSKQRSVYERSLKPDLDPRKGLNFAVEKAVDEGYFHTNELIEEVFGQTARDLSKINEFGNECLMLKYSFSEGMIFSNYMKYLSDEHACMDALVTKGRVLLMQIIHTVSLNDASDHFYIVSPVSENFESILGRISGGLYFVKRDIESVERDQPRANIFAPYISGNLVSLEAIEARDPMKASETHELFFEDLKGRFLPLIVAAQEKKNYRAVDALLSEFNSEFKRFGNFRPEEEQFESDRARLELSYSLLDHFFNSEGWGSTNTQILYGQISAFEEKFKDAVKRMGYDPLKRKMNLLL